MKWSVEELNKAIELLQDGNNFETIANMLNRGENSIKNKLNKLGYKQSDYIKVNYYHVLKCECCGVSFNSLVSENRKFCSQSCGASVNNTKYVKRIRLTGDINCYVCGVKKKSKRGKCCSQECNSILKFNEVKQKIESGDETLNSNQYRKYLIHKYGAKCMECGWGEVNPTSGKVPIELEHIDGNSDNNRLDNLKLLCPNCHSLTPTYKALNKGNGRHSRMERYHEGKSF